MKLMPVALVLYAVQMTGEISVQRTGGNQSPAVATPYTETFYLRASGDGSAPEEPDGAWDAADFNTGANWDTDDSNDGKFGPCDRMIVLDDDGVIRAQLTIQQPGLSGCPITIQGESGGSPTVSGADVVSTWTVTSADVWEATLTTDPTQVFVDGARGTEETGTCPDDLDTDTEWCWDSNLLYQNSTSDPDTRYTSPGTEASIRDYALFANGKDYITIKDLTITMGDLHNLRGDDSEDWIVDSITSSYAFDMGILGTGTGAGDNSNWIVRDNTVNYCGATGIQISTAGDNWLVSGNTIHNNSQLTGSGNQDYTGGIRFVGNTNITNNVIEGNTVYANGYGGTSGASGTQRGGGIWTDAVATGNVIRYNTIYGNYFNGVKLDIDGNGTQVYYNLVYNHTEDDGAGWGVGISVDWDADGSKIYNNAIYGNRFGISVLGRFPTQADNMINILVKNNISSGNTVNELRAGFGGENDGTNGYDNVYTYNCLGAEAAAFVEWGWGVSKATYDLWETAYGATTNSVEAAPLFVDAGADDFHLQSGSPARDAGTDVSLTRDYVNVAVPQETNPAIGAYEYIP